MTHRGHGTTTIDSVVDYTTAHLNLGVAEDTAGITAEGVVGIVVHTATAGIDIAKEGMVAVRYTAPTVGESVGSRNTRVIVDTVDSGVGSIATSRRIVVGHLATDNTSAHADVCILRHMAVGAATEDRTTNVRLATHTADDGIFDYHLGVVGVCHVVVFRMRGVARQTTTATEDRAFVMAGVTNTTTSDAHMRQTGTADRVAHLVVADNVGSTVEGGVHSIFSTDDITHDVVSATRDVMYGVAHRSQRATTEDIVVDNAAGDIHIGVAEDTACREAVSVVLVNTTTTAIDVAGIDVDTCAIQVLCLLGRGKLGTYLAALDLDAGVFPYMAVLGAAEDRATHHGGAVDGDIGILHIIIF